MQLNPRLLPGALALLSLAMGATSVRAATPPADTPPIRGKYLVEDVGLCADCHSPRNHRGEFIRASWLGGAPLAFAPTVPMPAWGPVAPAIAGLPTMTDEQALRFFTTGEKPDGTKPRPPMPGFRFNDEDARAIISYLRSLPKPAPVPAPPAAKP